MSDTKTCFWYIIASDEKLVVVR